MEPAALPLGETDFSSPWPGCGVGLPPRFSSSGAGQASSLRGIFFDFRGKTSSESGPLKQAVWGCERIWQPWARSLGRSHCSVYRRWPAVVSPGRHPARANRWRSWQSALEGPTSRAHLARLLWPDAPEPAARNNLVQMLRRLTKTYGAALVTALDLLSLEPSVRVDVRAREPWTTRRGCPWIPQRRRV